MARTSEGPSKPRPTRPLGSGFGGRFYGIPNDNCTLLSRNSFNRCNLSPMKVLALVALASGLAFTAGVYAYRALHSCDHDGKVQEQLRWVEQELCMRRAAREKRDLEMCYSLWTPEDFASLREH